LAQAVPETPEWVTATPKRGFLFPMKQWFEHEWAGELGGCDLSAPARLVAMDTWYRKWSVLAFEHWRQRATSQYD
jgi:asparagine synthase (glutamine-hydrolysing)